MNKVVKAFAKIKSQPDSALNQKVMMYQHDLESLENQKITIDRSEKATKDALTKAKKELKATMAKISDKEMKKLQDEITKIFTLPIKSLKVVRTESKTGYLPKILITTGMIYLAPFQNTNLSPDRINFFKKYIGKQLGRFLIQYDWSPKRNAAKICMVNLTNQAFGYQSATISSGTPCLGNIQDVTLELFNKKEFFKLTETLLDYVENTVYGMPHIQWDRFFNQNKPQQISNVKSLIFQDYPTRNNVKELKVIESMIPKKEWDILNRDTSKDEQYPYVTFNNEGTHENCHCEYCLRIRRSYALWQKFLEEHPETLPQTEIEEEESIVSPSETYVSSRIANMLNNSYTSSSTTL